MWLHANRRDAPQQDTRATMRNVDSFASSRAPDQRRASRSSAVASVLSCFAKQKRTTPDSCGA
ncbi:hypothetical protein SAMN05192564_1029 [Paraburkholderia sartisoli]|uniref:Uncharacterized protein n=1 Tax=Paraburkholderia sartisoli TaxID=83784 RepID=A0A1H4BX58_9BURK|nr:hypothetical protein SAMN05192564_1029 [Paraburkholderia sartisoli]